MEHDGDVVQWIAVGLDKRGRLLGACRLKGVQGAQLADSVLLDGTLLSVKARQLTSTPLTDRKKSAAPTKPISSWTIKDFHSHFQGVYRRSNGLGYPSLSAKDRENWKMILDGSTKQEVVEAVEVFVEKYAELQVKIPSLPSGGPTVGILRGWAPTIFQAIFNGGGEKTVREWRNGKVKNGGKF